MELYTLDAQLRRAAVIDRFESMIWTERYSEWGDFELHIFSTPEMRRLLPTGTLLAMSDSYRVMKVELVENSVDSEDRKMLKITGRSLEAILDERVARNNFADLTTTPKWSITGTPGAIARWIFNQICRTNALVPDDQIPFLVAGSLFPPGNVEEPSEEITIEVSLTTVYKAIKEICDAYDLGFRLLRNFDTSQLYFDVYSGNDRTTLQNVLAPVVFAPNLDNLTNISEVTSTGNYRNVAYVYHPIGVQIVTGDGVSVEVEGFERRVLAVDASDIKVPDRPYELAADQTAAVNKYVGFNDAPEELKVSMRKLTQKTRLNQTDFNNITTAMTHASLTAAERTSITNARTVSWNYNTDESTYINAMLQLRGRDELSKNRSVQAFDGELPITSPYRYEVAYQLGDKVEMRNDDGVTNQMRVTEQIFVSDSSGERAYPTLVIDKFITPGTWLSWDTNETWANADGVWGFADGKNLPDNILPNPGFELGNTYGWAGYSLSTLTAVSGTGEFRTGTYGLLVQTTDVDRGAAGSIATLAETPAGNYVGSVWIKGTTGHQYYMVVQEYTTASVLVGESARIDITTSGFWQQIQGGYTKLQEGTVLRISVRKATAGMFYLDDAILKLV